MKESVRISDACVFTTETQRIKDMDKNDIITDIVIQALIMDDTIKRQEIMIEQLKLDKNELLDIVAKMKELLPDSVQQLELFNL